jgi:hypothetical protein
VGSIPDLAFMAGCWEGPFRARSGEEGVIEERYTAPSANLMLGTTRYLLRGRTIQFELTTIRATDEGILFHPYPGGEPSSATFLLTRVGSDVAVFEAPEHDFPRRIMYTSEGGDRLVARTDDGTEDGQAISWRMRRVDC